MTVKELILELKKYDENLMVGIGNLEDDSDEAIVTLEPTAIAKLERFDDYEQKQSGGYFVAIGYECSICNSNRILE